MKSKTNDNLRYPPQRGTTLNTKPASVVKKCSNPNCKDGWSESESEVGYGGMPCPVCSSKPASVAEIVGKWREWFRKNHTTPDCFGIAMTRACEEYGVTIHQKLIVEAVERRVELQQLRQQLEWTQKALDMAGAGGMTELVAKLQSAEADTKRLERVAELEATIVFQDDQWEVYGLPSNHCIGRGKTLRAAIDAATEMNENTTR